MSTAWFVVDWQCCLGAGGAGEVFLGRSLDTWELCAIKVSTQLDRALAREELRQELAHCRRAAGEGVVGLIAWNLDADRPFLVFEFARAGSLADEVTALRQRGLVYHPARALERVRAILSALARVHERGLVHRDVKPANLLVFGDELRMCDFGTGRELDATGTAPNEGFVGTRDYAAPEQFRYEDMDVRSDLYSVGCILHEMLAGERFVPGTTETAYPNALVLPELDQLVRRFLADPPSGRPRNARHAIALVDSVLASYGTARRVWESLGLGRSPY
jgi:eukaryotic-like serine/threonine-protein kinase